MNHDIIPLPPLEPARGYSVPHAALYLDCSAPTVYQLIKTNRLASIALNKRRIIPGSELIRFLTGHDPTMAGDPIKPRMSELGRIGGKASKGVKAADLHRRKKSDSI